jgi:hypothetical protein
MRPRKTSGLVASDSNQAFDLNAAIAVAEHPQADTEQLAEKSPSLDAIAADPPAPPAAAAIEEYPRQDREQAIDRPIAVDATPNDPPAAESTADLIIGRVEELEASREQSRQAEQERLWGLYRKALLAPTAPTEHDLDRLVDVCAELGIGADQMRRDIEIIAKARRLEDLHSQHDEYNKARVKNLETLKQVKRENMQRLMAANKALGDSETLVTQSIFASDDLYNLAKQRPELFDLSSRPPRLLPWADPDRPALGPGVG